MTHETVVETLARTVTAIELARAHTEHELHEAALRTGHPTLREAAALATVLRLCEEHVDWLGPKG